MKTSHQLLLALFFSLFCTSTAMANTQLLDYQKVYVQCECGDTTVIDKSVAYFQGVVNSQPNNHLAMGFLGATQCQRAKHSFLFTTKLKYLNEGKASLAKAASAAPTDPHIQLLYAVAHSKIPAKYADRKGSFQRLNIIHEHQLSQLLADEKKHLYECLILHLNEQASTPENQKKINHYQEQLNKL